MNKLPCSLRRDDSQRRAWRVWSVVGGLALLSAGLGAACGGSSGPPPGGSGGAVGSGGKPGSGGSNASGSGGTSPSGSGGVDGSGGSGSGSGGAASGGSGSGGSASGGSASGGSASGGNTSGSGGDASGSGGKPAGSGGAASGGSGPGGGGANGGRPGGGGATASGGASGGSAAGGSAAGGSGAGGGSTGGGACGAGVFFCSGFEDAALPTGALYISSNDNNDWTKGTSLDKATFNGGKQSLKFLKLSAYSQREVSVPAAATFWFRAYLRTDVQIGGPDGKDHNLFFEAVDFDETQSSQQNKGVEIVEEDCELGVNIDDTRFGSNGTMNQPGCPTADPKGAILAANAWHCIEGFFDGTKGDFQIYVDPKSATDAPAIDRKGVAGAKRAFKRLRFGYREYHAHDRNTWYDDVATASARIGCM